MLIIRSDQMEAFSRYMSIRFEDRMLTHLRKTHPDKLAGRNNDEIRAMIRAGMKSAARYEVTDEADVERYLECVASYGPEFDLDPAVAWAGRILRNPDLTGHEKMDAIDEYILFMLR